MINSEISVETIDHLGIEAGLVDEIGIVEMLNKLYESELSDVFLEISLAAAEKFGVKRDVAHLDSTSFHVDGAYASPAPDVLEIS